jgi:hypothetical protein
MEGNDEELAEAMDAEFARQLAGSTELAAEFQSMFGPDDALVGQQWIAHGLTEHTEDVGDMVTSAQEKEKEEEERPEVGPVVDSGRTVHDLPARTRVLLINHDDSFYGAIGTVTGAASATHVRVTFDLKPTVSYDVPAAHLDFHRDAAQVRQMLEDAGGQWTFNGVPSLVEFLRAKEDENGAWAFTGSVALSYWARQYNVPFRHPHDIDIVVADLGPWYFDIVKAISGRPGEPPLRSDHKTVRLNMGTLDILAAGRGLGEFGSGPHTVGGVPVVGLRTIGAYKKRRGSPKDLEDLRVVDQLIRLQNP